jgi:hypothetical protein
MLESRPQMKMQANPDLGELGTLATLDADGQEESDLGPWHWFSYFCSAPRLDIMDCATDDFQLALSRQL